LKFSRSRVRVGNLLPLATITVGFAFSLRRLDDYDTWWHLASGRWIFDHQTIPTTDTLSFTVPNHPWINLQWLYDLVLYFLYSIGGADLLVITAAAAFTTALWLMMKNLRLWVDEVSASVLCLWVILIAEERFLIRPEMVSFVLLQALLWILMTARDNAGRRLWMLIPFMLLWVNSHSLFVIGLMCIFFSVAGVLTARIPLMPRGWREGSSLGPTADRRLLVFAAAAAAVTLVNPYFLDGLLFPFKLMSRFDVANEAFQAIGEFRRPFSSFFPTFSISAYQVFFFFSIAVVCIAAAIGLGGSRKEGSPKPERNPGFNLAWPLIFGGLAYLSFLARRNTALFAMGAAPIVGACLALIRNKMPGPWRDAARRMGRVIKPVLVTGCLALIVAVATNTYYRRDGTVREFGLGTFGTNFPVRAAAFSREVGLPPRLYNDMTAGGYLAWDAAVEGGVFIDGRLEVYDTEFFSAYMAAFSDPRVWQQQMEEYGIHTILLFHRWGNRHPMIRALVAIPEWTLVYHDEVAIIFVRSRGNEAVIAKAREIYPLWHDKISAALGRQTPRWQWPIERATALHSYAALLSSIGQVDGAVKFYKALLGFRPPPHQESAARHYVGVYLARKGERDQALAHLERAAELDPANRNLQEALQKVRVWVPTRPIR
jgi:hypothetical protein